MPTNSSLSETDDKQDKHNAIEKAFAILLSFLPANDAISTTDLSRELGFHKATTSRILRLMTEFGFVRQNEATKRYSLGPAIVKLAAAVNKSLNSGLVSLARPYLVELRKKTGQTVTLEVLSGHQAIMGCVVEGDMAIRVAGQTGDSIDWNLTAGMRAMLAFAEEDFQREVLALPMKAATPNSIVDPDRFRTVLAGVKKEGYSFECGEVAIGVDALAAPVFGPEGRPISSVSIVGLTHDIQEHRAEFVEGLKKTALDISRAFMYCD